MSSFSQAARVRQHLSLWQTVSPEANETQVPAVTKWSFPHAAHDSERVSGAKRFADRFFLDAISRLSALATHFLVH
jgi:hypothetical protein